MGRALRSRTSRARACPPRLVHAGEAVPGAPTVIIVTTPPRRQAAVGQIVDGELRAVWDPALDGAPGSADCDYVIAAVSRKHAGYPPHCPWCLSQTENECGSTHQETPAARFNARTDA